MPNKGGASRIRHIREAVGSFWDFTADVMGAIGVAGVTGDVVVLCAMGSVSVVGDAGPRVTLVSRVRQRSLVTLVSQVSQVPRVSYTLHGSVVAGVLRAS